jgi:hypothetical protein
MRLVTIGPSFVLVLAVPAGALAAALHVPADYPTIVAAVDAAASGDSVVVGPGTWVYRESRLVVVNGSLQAARSAAYLKPGVTLLGEAGAGATVIEADVWGGAGAQLVLLVPDQVDQTQIIVEGFTLRGLGVPNVGISANNCGPIVIRSCTVEGNMIGVQANRCDLELRDSHVRNNDTRGVLNVTASAVWGVNSNWLIDNTIFQANRGPAVVFNEITTVSHTTTVRDCQFLGNVDAIPLDLRDQDPLLIEGTTFIGNVNSSPTAAALCTFDCIGTVRGNTFANNSTTGAVSQGVIEVFDSELVITGNTIFGSSVPGPNFASAIVVANDVPWTFSRNIVAGSRGAAALYVFGSVQPSGGCNAFWDNPDGHYTNYVPKADDLTVDPLFCDSASLDLKLQSNSPCAVGNTPGCAQIGAWGVGCGPTSLTTASWGWIKGLYGQEE